MRNPVRTECVGWVAAVKAATHRDECMMGSAMRNPSYTGWMPAFAGMTQSWLLWRFSTNC
jgi:hypothetical protein